MKIKSFISIDHKSAASAELPHLSGGMYAMLVPGGCCCCTIACCCSAAIA